MFLEYFQIWDEFEQQTEVCIRVTWMNVESDLFSFLLLIGKIAEIRMMRFAKDPGNFGIEF